MKKINQTLVYQIIIVILFSILVLDMFIKIEYSSTKIEHILNTINQHIVNGVNNESTLAIHWKEILNDNIIKINDVTNGFLSDRSISFLFTILNIFLLSIGFYLLNEFNRIKEKTSNDLDKLSTGIIDANKLQEKNKYEFKLYNLFNRLYSRYLSLKYSEKSTSTDSFNMILRYILLAELTDINKTIKMTKSKNIIISKAVYDYGIDIINEVKSIPNQDYQGEIPADLLDNINETLLKLCDIINIEKFSLRERV